MARVIATCRRRISTSFVNLIALRYAAYTTTPSKPTSLVNDNNLKSIDDLPGVGIQGAPLIVNKMISTAQILLGDVSKSHKMLTENSKKYGKMYRNSMFIFDMVVLSDPKLIETFCRSEDKYPERLQPIPWIEYRKENNKPLGILLEYGERWQKSRSAMSRRLLRPEEISLFLNGMHGVSTDVLKRLKTLRPKDGPNKDIVPDLEEELFRWSFESACTVFFDKRLGILDNNSPKIHDDIDEFVNAFQNVLVSTADLMFKPYYIEKMLKTKSYNLHKESWDLLFRVSCDLINMKLNELAKNVTESDKKQFDDGSYLAYLVAQEKLSDEEIYGNMTEMLAAAVDTTSNSMLWMLYCLAKNPDCQERLYEEVTRVIPEGITPTKDRYNQMSYLKAVMQETHRLFPIIVGLGLSRRIQKDKNINGYRIPAGTLVLLDTYSITRNPEYFDDPLSFKPERWLHRVKGESLNNFLMLPFGVGVRSCIGRRLAEQEIHTLLVMIIRNFWLEIDKEIKIASRTLLVPDQPLDLRLVDRNERV
ncbi:1,25-dihydroxyvitamin D(3) 24-hydroxylase, mitochondrial-like [Antedon mediterranea]|uniref:1,25-dihydroxyvitamin D(3) 24-hydroxylase, mitochondrial-like n=1 Tax=Antedon mediterranea TaxID=105859 RepID=UPI003AF80241